MVESIAQTSRPVMTTRSIGRIARSSVRLWIRCRLEELDLVLTFVLVGVERILTSFEDVRKLIVKGTVCSGGIVAKRRNHDK